MELEEADLIIGLCDRFHCLPSQLEEEDISILRLLTIYHRGHKDDEPPSSDEYEDYN